MTAKIYCKKRDTDRISRATFKAAKDSCGDLILGYSLNTPAWGPCSRLEHFSLTKAHNNGRTPDTRKAGSFIVYLKSKQEMKDYKHLMDKAGFPYNDNWMGPDPRWGRWYGMEQGEFITMTQDNLPTEYRDIYEVYPDIGDLIYDHNTLIVRTSGGSSSRWLGSPRRTQTINFTTEENLINENINNQIKTSTDEKTILFTTPGSSGFGGKQQETTSTQNGKEPSPIEGRLISKYNRSPIAGRIFGELAERRGY